MRRVLVMLVFGWNISIDPSFRAQMIHKELESSAEVVMRRVLGGQKDDGYLKPCQSPPRVAKAPAHPKECSPSS